VPYWPLTPKQASIIVLTSVGSDCGDGGRQAAGDSVEHGSHSGVPPSREAMMASKPKAVEAAELIAGFNSALIFRHCPATDPAVGGVDHTEFFLQLDKPTQNKVMAAKLEGEAAVHKALADAHTQIAGILKSGG
jgi:hypothetical protein